jgi:hypothetical protein
MASIGEYTAISLCTHAKRTNKVVATAAAIDWLRPRRDLDKAGIAARLLDGNKLRKLVAQKLGVLAEALRECS